MGVHTNKWNICNGSHRWLTCLFWKHSNVSIPMQWKTVTRCLTHTTSCLKYGNDPRMCIIPLLQISSGMIHIHITTTKKTKTERLSVSLYYSDLVDYCLACIFRNRLTKGLGSHTGEGIRYLQWHQFESSLTGKGNWIRDRVRLEPTAYRLIHGYASIVSF